MNNQRQAAAASQDQQVLCSSQVLAGEEEGCALACHGEAHGGSERTAGSFATVAGQRRLEQVSSFLLLLRLPGKAACV